MVNIVKNLYLIPSYIGHKLCQVASHQSQKTVFYDKIEQSRTEYGNLTYPSRTFVFVSILSTYRKIRGIAGVDSSTRGQINRFLSNPDNVHIHVNTSCH